VLARVRISVPDRPGSLGLVASAIGLSGADIATVDVLESDSGRALDDVFVAVRDAAHLQGVRDHLLGVAGVQVVGVQLPAPPAGGPADLELLGQVLALPGRALQTLVDGAPGALGADWGAVIEFGADDAPTGVRGISPKCPGEEHVRVNAPLRLSTPRVAPPGGEPYGGTALVPLGNARLALLLVRESGPPFHRTELWRLEKVGQIAGSALR
jgi:hypothetical protein